MMAVSGIRENVDDDARISSKTDREVPAPAKAPAGGWQVSESKHVSKRQKDFNKVHKTGEDGLFSHNRRDVPLCPGFQKGQCHSRAGSSACPKDRSLVHQCAKCLHEKHGAERCSNDMAAEPPSKRLKGGKGKGKGKKGKSQW